MDDRVRAILSDDDFWKRVGDRLETATLEQKAAREAFTASQTFSWMLAAFHRTPSGTQFDTEEFGYFPERVRQRLGWEAASDAEVHSFIDLVATAPARPEVATSGCEASPDAEQFFNFGLRVVTISGQGTLALFVNDVVPELLDF
ncbi:hypothetical protein F6X40_27460 [Paraburkholderia sp. UCT31]|uniref:hypothetical protein n=1 Tax=Paraburkholderia sp. UCT31 TaxID=2615209 RepID=UPI00165569EF|nr:hypothetical protein [Paraburkholderia sp. UCT31]MBC8740399.1 hypothetical protein [Paraburkholderia sp. UCT31]